MTPIQAILPLCDEVPLKRASVFAAEVEQEGLQATGDDYGSDDDENSDGNLNAGEELLGFVWGFTKVPRGGAGTDHHQLLVR